MPEANEKILAGSGLMVLMIQSNGTNLGDDYLMGFSKIKSFIR